MSNSNNLAKAIFLMGPTATGKTDLALELAKIYPIEIISVDSALIYTDMDIGTAKPKPIELKQCTHYLIDIVNPLQTYSVANFIHDCNQLISDICVRGKIPLLVGGTMMYFNALINGINQLPESDPTIRDNLITKLNQDGVISLHDELLKIDNESAFKIMPTDSQRIIRALEVFYLTGIPISELYKNKTNQIKLSANIEALRLMILPNNRELLHNRINRRFLNMLDNGLIEEVISIRDKYPQLTINHASMRCVGYYQAWQFIDNLITLQELKDMGCATTRQLAKRQITWLKRFDGVNLDINDNLSFSTIKNTAVDLINRFI